MQSLQPIDQYLRAYLVHRLDTSVPEPAPPGDLDWQHLPERLAYHRLTSLFSGFPQALEAAGWPEELCKRMRAERLHTLLIGESYAKAIGQVLDAFASEKISMIVLKGWALITLIYKGDLSLRQYDDIDLLIHPRHARRAEEILLDLGYQPGIPEPWPGYHIRYRNSRAFLLRRSQQAFGRIINIGLHWGLLDTPYYDQRISVDALFARSSEIKVAGRSVRQMDPVDHLVYSCGHLALHHSYHEALLRYYEQARYLQQLPVPIDWQTLVARTREWRLVIPTRRVLAHLEALFPGTVDAQALQALDAHRPGWLERTMHDSIVTQTNNHALRAALALLTLRGAVKRLRFVYEVTFPSPKYMRQRYGPATGPQLIVRYLQRYANLFRDIGSLLSCPDVTRPEE